MYNPFLLALFSFFGAVQLSNKFGTGPVLNSIVAVGIPFAATTVIKWIYANGYGSPVWGSVFTVTGLATVGVQFAVSLFVFKRIETEEGIAAMMGWAIGGALLVVVAIPFISQIALVA